MLTAEEIDKVLPQTQCNQCGYKGCMEYARALLDGEAINRCPPGGDEGIILLAKLLGQEIIPLNSDCGVHVPFEVARINPKLCIGCKLCIKVCPTDAIIGSPKHMHYVDDEYCTGCCLCQIACPMDCIDMITEKRGWTEADKLQARQRYNERKIRIEQQEREANQKLSQKESPEAKKNLLASLMKRKK